MTWSNTGKYFSTYFSQYYKKLENNSLYRNPLFKETTFQKETTF
jgi:hypothetical protein